MPPTAPDTLDAVALPSARGPLSRFVLARLAGVAVSGPVPAVEIVDPVEDEDLQLALYLCYELHYHGLPGVPDELEWDLRLLEIRASLERRFEDELRRLAPPAPHVPVEQLVATLVEAVPGPSIAEHVRCRATLDQTREYVLHRSAYQRKEGDPHTWAIPRLAGSAKQHLVRIQAGEYGADADDRVMHAELFATTMSELGLDARVNADVDRLPAASLAVSNLASMLGLHRRLRAALVGHLALSEMTSVEAMRRYVAGLERLGTSADARRFFKVHVLADAEHEEMALQMLRALVADDPASHDDVAFGISASLLVERAFACRLVGCWSRGETSLRTTATERTDRKT